VIASLVNVRPITADDAEAAAQLSGELGYPLVPAAMRARLDALSASADHGVFVACLDGAVVGWIHVAAVLYMQSDPRAEVWARAHGFGSILVRSQVTREDAHRFYLREGYTQTKTSAVFAKSLV